MTPRPAGPAPRDAAGRPAFRLVALDIDGTLLNPAGHVSPRTAAAVSEVLVRGVQVVLCTGRSFGSGIGDLARELGLSLPAILRNGAAVQDTGSSAVLSQRVLSAAAVRAALDAILAAGATPLVQEGPRHGDAVYTPPDGACDPAVVYYERLWNRGLPYQRAASVEALFDVREPSWIGACGTGATTGAAYATLRCIEGVASYWTGGFAGVDVPDHHVTAIQPAGCSKASALADFAAERGIDLADVLAVGDFFNDIEMLTEVGWGVAMGHAPDAVKAVAKAVVPDNARDGCAVALERFVLGSERV